MDVHTDGASTPPTQDARPRCAHRHTWVVIAVGQAQCQQCQLIVPIRMEEGTGWQAW